MLHVKCVNIASVAQVFFGLIEPLLFLLFTNYHS